MELIKNYISISQKSIAKTKNNQSRYGQRTSIDISPKKPNKLLADKKVPIALILKERQIKTTI